MILKVVNVRREVKGQDPLETEDVLTSGDGPVIERNLRNHTVKNTVLNNIFCRQ